MEKGFEKGNINWFPGHMAKTRRQIKESLKLVDAVVEIIDSRIPVSSRNPEIDALVSKKPRIILLNKCDVSDEKLTKQWISYFEGQNMTALAVDCRSGRGLSSFLPTVRQVLAEKIRINIEKGMKGKPLRLMIVGIPNTGKSSFINRMAKKNRAQVADRPGVTRQNQWFAIGDGIELLDTPGVLWPKFEDPEVGRNLAYTGAIKDEIMDIETLAYNLLEVLVKDHTDKLAKRYEIADISDKSPLDIMDEIGKKRGMLLRGGEINYERVSVMLLDEFRAGTIGKITLEKP
ncbi:MAG: ribosome biogenesis GTPase YlqF [Clostridia bacterium]|nr:ribosome biogenesis GTPase YlqF [Clostridia bacterium]